MENKLVFKKNFSFQTIDHFQFFVLINRLEQLYFLQVLKIYLSSPNRIGSYDILEHIHT